MKLKLTVTILAILPVLSVVSFASGAAVCKYVPEDVTNPAPGPTETTEPTDEPESSETTAEPELTVTPESTAVPETTTLPQTTEAPETTLAPETTSDPEPTIDPDTTAVPETTSAPETTPEPSTNPPITTTTTTTTTAAPPTAKPAASLKCTGVGFFPDPKDCSAYHFCAANSLPSEAQRCPAGSVFHYSASGVPCKLSAAPEDCLTVRCDPLKIYQEYDSAKLFYAYCYGGKVDVFRCPDGFSFNGAACTFKCQTEGFYANSAQPTTYYQCYYAYGSETLSLRMLYCPRDLKFDMEQRKCV